MGKKQSKKDEEYHVKDILDFKEEDGHEFFLIWWKGYPKGEATWQPVQNMRHLLDFNLHYGPLKEQHNKQCNQSISQEQADQSLSYQIQSSQLSRKNKQIAKSKKDKSQKAVEQSVEQKQVVQKPVQSSKQDNQKAMIDEKSVNASGDLSKQQLKRRLKEAKPVQFQVKIKLFKNLPYAGEQIKTIRQAAQIASQKSYQVQFHNIVSPQPVILHQNYLKVMWPKQFCQFLLSKSR